MATYGIIAAGPQKLFHTAARVTKPGDLHLYFADANNLVSQRQQVYAADNDVPAQQFRAYRFQTGAACDDRQMLGLDKRCMTSAATPAVPITGKAMLRIDFNGLDNAHGGTALGTDTQPLNAASLRHRCQELGEWLDF